MSEYVLYMPEHFVLWWPNHASQMHYASMDYSDLDAFLVPDEYPTAVVLYTEGVE
jgi:hypothetical protein